MKADTSAIRSRRKLLAVALLLFIGSKALNGFLGSTGALSTASAVQAYNLLVNTPIFLFWVFAVFGASRAIGSHVVWTGLHVVSMFAPLLNWVTVTYLLIRMSRLISSGA